MTDPTPESGRELDAEVAEEVMGQERCSGWRRNSSGHLAKYCDHEPGECMAPGPTQVMGVLPHYSTDIEAAWQIVETLSLPDKVSFGVLRLFDGGWKAYTYSEDCGLDIEAEAGTAPLAICRCALKAVRADTEGADGGA